MEAAGALMSWVMVRRRCSRCYMGEMTYRAYKPDAWAGGYMLGTLNRNPQNYSPTSAHEFIYHLHNPQAKVRVEAIDGWGNTYSQTEFISTLSTAEAYQ